MIKHFLFIILFSLTLSSFSQKDTLDYTIYKWGVDEYHNKNMNPIDTFLEGAQIYIPVYFNNISQAYNGNAGQASQSTIFLERQEEAFYFLTPYSSYLFTPSNAKFYNTHQAYTVLNYVTNFSTRNNLQNLDLFHTQNILPNLNVGFQYRLLGANGEYKAQKASNHFFRAFTSYEHKNYEAFLVYNYNKFNSYLNGGLTSDTILDNPQNPTSKTDLFPVHLEDSKNSILGRNLNLKHNYIINKRLPLISIDSLQTLKSIDSTITEMPVVYAPLYKIGHELDWNYNKRIYTNEGSPNYYQEFFQDTSAILGAFAYDSTGYSNFNNTFFIRLLDDTLNNKLPSITIAYQNSQEFFHSYENNQYYMHHSAKFQLDNSVYDRWYWNFNTKYTFAGGNKGDLIINGNVQKFFGKDKQHSIRFSPSYSKTCTNIFTQSFSSNFYKWNNPSFKKFALSTLELAYKNDRLKLEIGIKQSYLDNFIYFASKQDSVMETDTTKSYEWVKGYPFQETSTFGLLTVFLNHKLDFGALHMINSVVYQQNGNDSVLHIPDFSYYNSTYFQMRFFKRVLTVQIGFDLRFTSSYYIDGFIPATGLYYNQYEKQYGNYPYVDFFVNAKLKRARLFIKLEHVNKGLSGNQYYTVYKHPMNPRVFRFGLSWRFYN